MRTGIALGSNLGDRLARLREAREAVMEMEAVREPVLLSPVYETEPVDCEPDAGAYLNAVIEVEYDGQPIVLLEALHAIEQQMGRPSRRPRNAPRTIDMDILYVGNLTLTNPEIVIPHPRLHRRRFVLAPLNDVRPDLVLPGHELSVARLLARLPTEPNAVRHLSTW